MRRTQLLAIIPLLMFSLAMAQTSGPQPAGTAQEHPLIQSVNVLKSADGISVEITGSGTLSATATAVANPDRVVVDVPGAVVSRFRHIAIGADGIKAVRLGQNSAHPPVARLVVDLAAARDYQLVPEGNRVVLKLRPVALAKAHSTAPEAVAAAPAASPVLAQASTKPAPSAKDFV
ncbi:MAG TPA: AMIN domain-containing protein, partial [Terriglobales bacterium]|nr:AMIN domain-containing protein [Terriglobales bacterium]